MGGHPYIFVYLAGGGLVFCSYIPSWKEKEGWFAPRRRKNEFYAVTDSKHWVPPWIQIKKDALLFWNAALTYARRELPFFSKNARFAFDVTSSPEEGVTLCRLRHHEGSVLYIAIEAFPFKELLGVALDYRKLDILGEDLREAFNEGIISLFRKLVPEDFFDAFESRKWGCFPDLIDESVRKDLVWFQVEIVYKEKAEIVLLAGVLPRDLKTFLSCETLSAEPVQAELLEGIQENLSYTLVSTKLLLSEIRALRRGDLLVLPEELSPTRLSLTRGPIAYICDKTEEGWICSAIKRRHFPDLKIPLQRRGARPLMETNENSKLPESSESDESKEQTEKIRTEAEEEENPWEEEQEEEGEASSLSSELSDKPQAAEEFAEEEERRGESALTSLEEEAEERSVSEDEEDTSEEEAGAETEEALEEDLPSESELQDSDPSPDTSDLSVSSEETERREEEEGAESRMAVSSPAVREEESLSIEKMLREISERVSEAEEEGHTPEEEAAAAETLDAEEPADAEEPVAATSEENQEEELGEEEPAEGEEAEEAEGRDRGEEIEEEEFLEAHEELWTSEVDEEEAAEEFPDNTLASETSEEASSEEGPMAAELESFSAAPLPSALEAPVAPISREGIASQRARDLHAIPPDLPLQNIDVPVTVDFSFGRIGIPLSELNTWAVGQILPLNPPRDIGALDIKICVNGQVIATGDILRLDDRFAVRIANFYGFPGIPLEEE